MYTCAHMHADRKNNLTNTYTNNNLKKYDNNISTNIGADVQF